jgi:diacylglycerol O-acyltransferase-1
MATITQMASSSALDIPQTGTSLYRGKTTEQKANSTTKRIRDTKYRHVFATHSSSRTSCLSQGSEATPSFVGFRNLMILVLSTHLHYRLNCK